MSKYYVGAWTILLALITVMPSVVQGETSLDIAFLDMEQVFSEYVKTQKADARLKEQAEEFNSDRNAKLEVLRELEENFNAIRDEAQDQTLSKEARDRKRGEAEEMLNDLRENEKEIRKFEEIKRKELEEQGRRMRKRIVDEINVVVEKFAKERNLHAVVDSSGPSLNRIPVFMYADEKFDVTDEIVAQLNRDETEGEGSADDVGEPSTF